VVVTFPAIFVELGFVTLPEVAKPPEKVSESPPSPRVTVPVFRKLVSPPIEVVPPVKLTEYPWFAVVRPVAVTLF
jgi:hypothetical protein